MRKEKIKNLIIRASLAASLLVGVKLMHDKTNQVEDAEFSASSRKLIQPNQASESMPNVNFDEWEIYENIPKYNSIEDAKAEDAVLFYRSCPAGYKFDDNNNCVSNNGDEIEVINHYLCPPEYVTYKDMCIYRDFFEGKIIFNTK